MKYYNNIVAAYAIRIMTNIINNYCEKGVDMEGTPAKQTSLHGFRIQRI